VSPSDARNRKGKIMNPRKFENGLALLGVLIVMFGVGAAANTALASEAEALNSSLKISVSTTD
jgi:hypothetical protein